MSKIIVIIVAVLIIVASQSLYILNEKELAIKLRLGEVVAVEKEPGLKFKLPFVNNIITFDKRIQNLDEDPDRFLTGDKENLNVDSYIKWRIQDPVQFYKSTAGDIFRANSRLSQITNAGLKNQFSRRTIPEVVSGERNEIMQTIADSLQLEAKDFGIEIVDVRIKRVDFPQEISNSVYERMRSERERIAKEYRSQGREAGEKIRADADKQRTIIVSNAYRDSEKIRGEGDAISANNYASAYSQDAKFYNFYRSLESYRKSFTNKDDILVLDPNTTFFKAFNPQ